MNTNVMKRNKKETVSFVQTIPAGSSRTLSRTIRAPGNISRIFGKFNAGQQNSLHVRPYLILHGDRIEDLITYPAGSNSYISGDNDSFDIGIDFDVLPDYQLVMEVENTSAYDYTLEIKVEVDYVGGTARVV